MAERILDLQDGMNELNAAVLRLQNNEDADIGLRYLARQITVVDQRVDALNRELDYLLGILSSIESRRG